MKRADSVLVVDNRDSFVFNLVADLARLGLESTVVRGDMDPGEFDRRVESEGPRLVLLSPGPGHPASSPLMASFLSRRLPVPVLGICLGMQALACSCGGRVDGAPRILHGKASAIYHRGDPLFAGIEPTFRGGRYHSLAVSELPEELVPIAWSHDPGAPEPVVMGIRHAELPWFGFQFHPESILTPCGPRLLRNVLETLS